MPAQVKLSNDQLLAALQTLTPDQLAQTAQYWGENVGGYLLRPGAVGGTPLTYLDLLEELECLPTVMLEAQASYAVPTHSFGQTKLLQAHDITQVEVLAEDYVNPSGDGAEPVSNYCPAPGEEFVEGEHLTEEELALECVQSAGTVMLVVEWAEVE